MDKSNKKVDLLLEIENANAYLESDIQALAYISEEIMLNKTNKYLDVHFIENSIETLLRAMSYNKEQMQKAINTAYTKK